MLGVRALIDGFAVAHARAAGAASRGILTGLVGRGITLSRSPVMHEREGERLGLDYTYATIDFDQAGLPDSALGDVVAAAEAAGFAGLNVTHPFKQLVGAHLTELTADAEAIGAVNTVVFTAGRRSGHNTDSWGFAESVRAGLGGCAGAAVVQFGAGGGGAAVARALLTLGAGSLAICDPDHIRAEQLAARLGSQFAQPVRAVTDVEAALLEADGIVNATPMGMEKYPGTPFAQALLQPRHWVADIVYFPAETELLRRARALGCRTLPGRGMAVFQAVRAFELFTGIAPDSNAMARHFDTAA